jgi:hypothetical protein
MDQSSPINQLTPAERQQWCDWFNPPPPPGFPPDPVKPADSDGYYPQTSCLHSGQFFSDAQQPVGLPAAACVDNLALSHCPLPLAALTDCVRSMRMQWPQPHGCAPYLQTPGCAGTMITLREDCRVRVE